MLNSGPAARECGRQAPKGRRRGLASPWSHAASSDPSPQLSFPSHRWLCGRHFPLLHLKVSGGQPGEARGLSRGWRVSRGPRGAQPPPRAPLTAALLVTAVLAVLHGVTDPEEGLAELVRARELVGGVALWRGDGPRLDARLTEHPRFPGAGAPRSRGPRTACSKGGPQEPEERRPVVRPRPGTTAPRLGPSRRGVGSRSRAQQGQRVPGLAAPTHGSAARRCDRCSQPSRHSAAPSGYTAPCYT